MSAFLGHIHYWLYGKIRRVIEREQMLFEKANEICGDTAEELREQVWQTYGQPLPDTDLADLIDHTNIHGWLQRQVNVAETREAAFIKELLDSCGDAAKNAVAETFAQHGRHCGDHAKNQGRYISTEAKGMYQALNDYLLNGMPCDMADRVMESNQDRIVWESAVCLQEPNWKRAGVSAPDMKNFYQHWLAGFMEGLNPEFKYEQTADTLQGAPVNRHQIAK